MVIRRSLSWRSLSVSARTYVRSDCNEFLISATSGQAAQDAVDAAGQFNCQYQNVFCVCVCVESLSKCHCCPKQCPPKTVARPDVEIIKIPQVTEEKDT